MELAGLALGAVGVVPVILKSVYSIMNFVDDTKGIGNDLKDLQRQLRQQEAWLDKWNGGTRSEIPEDEKALAETLARIIELFVNAATIQMPYLQKLAGAKAKANPPSAIDKASLDKFEKFTAELWKHDQLQGIAGPLEAEWKSLESQAQAIRAGTSLWGRTNWAKKDKLVLEGVVNKLKVEMQQLNTIWPSSSQSNGK